MGGHDDKVQGKWDEAKGKVKQAVGDATDNEEMKREGQMDEAKGEGRQAVGEAKDALDNAKDSIKDAFKKDN